MSDRGPGPEPVAGRGPVPAAPSPSGTPKAPVGTPQDSVGTPEASVDRPSAPATSSPGTSAEDPLRGSRASGLWVAVVALVVLLTLLAIFVLQNTQPVEVSFLGWEGDAPLAAALLIAVAAGLLIAVVAGSLRILQLRRRVRREQKR